MLSHLPSVPPGEGACWTTLPIATEFSPKLIGLTGSPEQVTKAARAYRVYFTVNPGDSGDPNSDYLVDHSIFFYLLDPAGRFVDYYGQNKTAADCVGSIAAHIRNYQPIVSP